jgi:hypothetical protein
MKTDPKTADKIKLKLVREDLTLREYKVFDAWFTDAPTFSACSSVLSERTGIADNHIRTALRTLVAKGILAHAPKIKLANGQWMQPYVVSPQFIEDSLAAGQLKEDGPETIQDGPISDTDGLQMGHLDGLVEGHISPNELPKQYTPKQSAKAKGKSRREISNLGANQVEENSNLARSSESVSYNYNDPLVDEDIFPVALTLPTKVSVPEITEDDLRAYARSLQPNAMSMSEFIDFYLSDPKVSQLFTTVHEVAQQRLYNMFCEKMDIRSFKLELDHLSRGKWGKK